MKTILYIPLDDRPCNYQYPQLLSQITLDTRLMMPPLSMMGRCKTPADIEGIWQWLFDHAADADYAILSVDTLVYGNIIHSRTHHRTQQQIVACMNRFKKLKEINPSLSIEAFNLVARVAGYNNDFEDPDYWKTYGYRIWKYGYLKDRINRGFASTEEIMENKMLQAEIPADILKDFLDRREKDAMVNRYSVDLVCEGVFSHLVVPKDDTAEFGYAAIDQRSLIAYIDEKRLHSRIMVYPGADEVGSVLFTRVFNQIHHWSPRIHVHYSSTLGPTIVPSYEDRPLGESIKAQITSLGGIMVNSDSESDLLFAVNSPGKIMQESSCQPQEDLSYSTYVGLHELFEYIRYYHRTYGRPVALSDVAYGNGADIRMMMQAQQCGVLDIIRAYGGWNTAENTNGMCLAHICIHTYCAQHDMTASQQLASKAFLARKVLEDYLYQAVLTPNIAREVQNLFEGCTSYDCSAQEEKIADYCGERLREAAQETFGGDFQGSHMTISDFSLPWNRVYELGFHLELKA